MNRTLRRIGHHELRWAGLAAVLVIVGSLTFGVLESPAVIGRERITTIAGTGMLGFSGDGGRAVRARLASPTGVALDAAGNLYIADADNNRIRKVDRKGIITTFAGNGKPGFSGDGGPSVKAELSAPTAVVADAAGNLYVADHFNNRVRKVGANGQITTIAGNGTEGFSGGGRSATSAMLDQPDGLAVDSAGNVYIVDLHNNRIRRVDRSGVITTVAGREGPPIGGFSGDGGKATRAELAGPCGNPALDRAGNLYFADQMNNRIRKVDRNGIITTVAGPARLDSPCGVALDAVGNLYVADEGNNVVREVSTSRIITTVAGNPKAQHLGDEGPATRARLDDPTNVAVDKAGNLYIAEASGNRIREVIRGQRQ